MIKEETLKNLLCALSDSKHFSIDPIILSKCGHSVCKSCLATEENIQSIKCKLCGLITEEDFKEAKISESLKIILKSSLVGIFDILEKEANLKLETSKKNMEIHEEYLNAKYKYIEDEIDLRIESIKQEVDRTGNTFKEKLLQMKKMQILHVNESNLNDMKSTLEELQNNIKKNINLNEEYLEKYQKRIQLINESFGKFYICLKFPEIYISNENIYETLIGEVYFQDKKKSIEVKNLLINGKQEMFNISKQSYDFIALPNGYIILLTVHFTLIILDQNYHFVREITNVNGDYLYVKGLCYNEDENVFYISDKHHRKILMVDWHFNLMRSVCSKGTDEHQFDNIEGLCFKNENLYVCDTSNNRIQIFDSILNLVNSLKLDFSPLNIKVSESLICIESSWISPGTYFYHVNNLSFHSKFEFDETGRISEINSHFYEFHASSKTMTCYNKNGNLEEKFVLSGFSSNSLSDRYDGAFSHYRGKLIMLSYSQTKLITFSHNLV